MRRCAGFSRSGRAVGFYVFAFVQDPRKETIGMRHMFPQKVSLRLDEASEVDMVLGEGARRRGAEAHQIDRSTPGVGFAVAEIGRGGTVPGRVRHRCADPADRLHPSRTPPGADRGTRAGGEAATHQP